MRRNRIVNDSRDIVILEILLKLISSAGNSKHILMPYTCGALRNLRLDNKRIVDALGIAGCQLLSLHGYLVHMGKLNSKQPCLKLIKS